MIVLEPSGLASTEHLGPPVLAAPPFLPLFLPTVVNCNKGWRIPFALFADSLLVSLLCRLIQLSTGRILRSMTMPESSVAYCPVQMYAL
jgi:hypothetical protein